MIDCKNPVKMRMNGQLLVFPLKFRHGAQSFLIGFLDQDGTQLLLLFSHQGLLKKIVLIMDVL